MNADHECGSVLPYLDATVGILALAVIVTAMATAPACGGNGGCIGRDAVRYLVVFPAIAVGLPPAASALYGFHVDNRCRGMKAAAVKQAKERDEFIRLSDMALAAARAGDCTSAFAIEERVRALDRVVHATVLAPAPTMQACRDLVQRREPSLNTR